MKRRNFIQAAALSGVGVALNPFNSSANKKRVESIRGTFSETRNKVLIYTKTDIEPARIFHITDTHLSIDDERGKKYREFSKRMAKGYNVNSHFRTNEKLSAKESFELTLNLAKEQKVDFLALTGDIFSFPSEAAVEWAFQKLTDTGIPFAYIAGNHDWHYEGMKGSEKELRSIWTAKRLKIMYQGNNPLFATYKFRGVRYVCIDNSTYEIEPDQLNFFNEQVKSNEPMILLIHIPLFMPGRPIGFGCANPEWGAKTDKNFEIERRERWPEKGHSKTTYRFYDEVFNAPNLLTVLAGHTHQQSLDIKNGVPQFVSAHNATAYYADIRISTLPKYSK